MPGPFFFCIVHLENDGFDMNLKRYLHIANFVGFGLTLVFLFYSLVTIPVHVFTFQHRPEYADSAMKSWLITVIVFVLLLVIDQVVIWRLIRKIEVLGDDGQPKMSD